MDNSENSNSNNNNNNNIDSGILSSSSSSSSISTDLNNNNTSGTGNNNNNNSRNGHAIVGKKRGGPLKLYYETYGNINAPIKVLFIMGFMSTLRDWYPQVEYYKQFKEYEICVFDNRGIGGSGIAKRYSTSDLALDAVELMDHLQWETAHIVGASMGGMTALEFASRAPTRIRTLTLAVTHSGLSFPTAKGTFGFFRSLFHKDYSKKADLLLDTLFSKQFLSSPSEKDSSKTNRQLLTEEYVEKMSSSKPPPISTLFGHLRCILTHHVSNSRLKEIKNQDFPILVLTATDDYLVKPKNSYSLKNKLSPSEFIVYQSCGHSVNIEKLNEFNTNIENHFSRFKDDERIIKELINSKQLQNQQEVQSLPQQQQQHQEQIETDSQKVPSLMTNTTAVISQDS